MPGAVNPRVSPSQCPRELAVPMRRSDEPMFEYACHEGNYGLLNILSGARAELSGAPAEDAGAR